MCDQQSLRSACPYGQSDQSLCLSLEYSISVKLPTDHHLVFLSLSRGCTGSSESTLVKIPHCWKSHVATHLDCIPRTISRQCSSVFACKVSYKSLMYADFSTFGRLSNNHCCTSWPPASNLCENPLVFYSPNNCIPNVCHSRKPFRILQHIIELL